MMQRQLLRYIFETPHRQQKCKVSQFDGCTLQREFDDYNLANDREMALTSQLRAGTEK